MERKVIVKAIKKIILDINEKCIIKNTAIMLSLISVIHSNTLMDTIIF